jgi:hypothetical protein
MPAQTNPTSLSLSGGIEIFTYTGDPNAAVVGPRDAHAQSFPGANESLALAALGSVCIDPTTGWWWRKTQMPGVPGSGATGVWTTNSPSEIAGPFPVPASSPAPHGSVTPTTGAGEVKPVSGKAPAPAAHSHTAATPHGAAGAGKRK